MIFNFYKVIYSTYVMRIRYYHILKDKKDIKFENMSFEVKLYVSDPFQM